MFGRPMHVFIGMSLAWLSGCSSQPNLDHVYPIGQQREDLHLVVWGKPAKPIGTIRRLSNGEWDPRTNDSFHVEVALARAKLAGTIHGRAHLCDIHYVPRGSMGLGIWWDFVFFDESEKLIGYYRRFVD